ncbi:MAG TPA: tripartite tricarboxylate transporter substrate binding protein [Usitatibacter sp.]|nr:tripartite tricarboxylate transporter substrate binding protein [Usitatibacter sp.]
MSSRRAFLAAAALAAAGCPAWAELPWPSRPVKLVVGYPIGGSNDRIARELGRRLSEAWKVPVTVENQAGSGGTLGADVVAKARPDGYTLCFLSSSFATNAAVQPSLPFDPIRSFTPVAMVARGPMILTVSNAVPARSMLELFALARREPNGLSYASPGPGSSGRFAMQLLMDAAGIRMRHMAYPGVAPAVTDLIAGRVDVLIASAPSVYEQVKSGHVRALGVTSLGSSPLLPDLPPIAQMGVPGYRFEVWWGILAPSATPQAVVEKVNAAVGAILATAEMKAMLAKEGADPSPLTPSAFAANIAGDIGMWRKVAKQADIKAE